MFHFLTTKNLLNNGLTYSCKRINNTISTPVQIQISLAQRITLWTTDLSFLTSWGSCLTVAQVVIPTLHSHTPWKIHWRPSTLRRMSVFTVWFCLSFQSLLLITLPMNWRSAQNASLISGISHGMSLHKYSSLLTELFLEP